MANVKRYLVSSYKHAFLYSENFSVWKKHKTGSKIKGFYYSLIDLKMTGWLNKGEQENTKQWEI